MPDQVRYIDIFSILFLTLKFSAKCSDKLNVQALHLDATVETPELFASLTHGSKHLFLLPISVVVNYPHVELTL